MRRVIVCGSRGWHDRQRIQDRFADLVLEDFPGENIVIVHGAARGADRIAADEAGKSGLYVESHPADWGQYGKSAGFKRNEEMASLGADLCLAFWDGRSNGTTHMMSMAEKYRIPVEVIR